jgi:pimeloyl-ACP methyl ester carboxylesterase
MAVDHQKRLKGVVFAAPTLDPGPQEEWWLRDVGNVGVVRFMLGDWLDNCNQEMLALANELWRLSPELKSLEIPMCIIHGEADVLVDVSNIEYLQRSCPHASIKVYSDAEMNHFIPWSHPHLIIQSIEHIENE